MTTPARDEVRFRSPVDQAGYVQLSKVVLHDVTLSKEARFTYGLLLSYAWQDPETFVGHETLAWDLQVTVRSVHNYLKELQRAGLIDIERRRSPRGEWLTNTYWIEQLEDRYGQLTEARARQVAESKTARSSNQRKAVSGGKSPGHHHRKSISNGPPETSVRPSIGNEFPTTKKHARDLEAVKSARAGNRRDQEPKTEKRRPPGAVANEKPKLVDVPVPGTGTVDLNALERRLAALHDGNGELLDPRAVAHALEREAGVLSKNGGCAPERHNPWAYVSKIAREEHAKLRAGDDRKSRARELEARVAACERCDGGYVMVEQDGHEAAMKCPDCLGSAAFGRLDTVS